MTTYGYDPERQPDDDGLHDGSGERDDQRRDVDYYHDQNGNLVTKMNPSTGEAWTYGYDNRNQLIAPRT